MKERIKYIRKYSKLTQQEFADRIGVKRNSLANYEIGRNVPIDAIILSICKEFNVNEEWLRTGFGEPFIEMTEDEEIAAWVARVLRNREETIQKRLLKLLTQFSENDWKAIEILLHKGETLLKEQNK